MIGKFMKKISLYLHFSKLEENDINFKQVEIVV